MFMILLNQDNVALLIIFYYPFALAKQMQINFALQDCEQYFFCMLKM